MWRERLNRTTWRNNVRTRVLGVLRWSENWDHEYSTRENASVPRPTECDFSVRLCGFNESDMMQRLWLQLSVRCETLFRSVCVKFEFFFVDACATEVNCNMHSTGCYKLDQSENADGTHFALYDRRRDTNSIGAAESRVIVLRSRYLFYTSYIGSGGVRITSKFKMFIFKHEIV